MTVKTILASAALWLSVGPAWSDHARCRDYINAAAENRSAIDGFISGFVSAKLEGRSDDELDRETERAKAMVNDYCLEKPEAPIATVIAIFGSVVGKR